MAVVNRRSLRQGTTEVFILRGIPRSMDKTTHKHTRRSGTEPAPLCMMRDQIARLDSSGMDGAPITISLVATLRAGRFSMAA